MEVLPRKREAVSDVVTSLVNQLIYWNSSQSDTCIYIYEGKV